MAIPIPEVTFKPYEEEIIKLWKEGLPDLPWKWGVAAASPKSRFIRGFLLEKGQACPKETWEAWSDFCDRAGKIDVHFKRGDYATMRHSFWLLKRLGLITLVRRVPSVRKGYWERNMYTVNPRKINDPAWLRPLQILYPNADWTKMPSTKKHEVRRRMKARKRAEKRFKLLKASEC
jgi:hypothetical protein